MSGEHSDQARTDGGTDWPRRALLKATGAGAGIAALAGVTVAREGNRDEEDTDAETTADRHFVEDLVDPTFGYPLAADETDDVDLDHQVEAYTEEGEGAHRDFPQVPEEDFPYEFAFDPVGIHVRPGELVHFRITSGEHTVTAIHEKFSAMVEMPMRVPEESPGFTSPPLLDDESWVYQFETEGVYDVACLPHFFAGMVMRVVVSETDDLHGPEFEAPADGQLPPNAQAVFDAQELEPRSIVDSGTVAWGDLTIEVPELQPSAEEEQRDEGSDTHEKDDAEGATDEENDTDY